jgi:hypothetical protein
LGVPVVPLVYWMMATSSVAGPGKDAGSFGTARSFSQGVAPLVRVVSASRDSRAFAIGRRSARRERHGGVTSTLTRW